MREYEKLIFVCRDNTSRGPMAEALMNKVKGDNMLEVTSRGMVVLFPEPYNPKCISVLKRYNIKFKNRSAIQLEEEDFGEKVLVLTMDDSIKRNIYERFEHACHVYTLKEYTGGTGDVKDPYGGDIEEYIKCYEEIYELVTIVSDKLFKEDNDESSIRL